MKKLTVLTLASTFAILIFSGCKKSSDSSKSASFTANVDGAPWKAQYTTALEHAGSNGSSGYIAISGAYGKAAGDTSFIELELLGQDSTYDGRHFQRRALQWSIRQIRQRKDRQRTIQHHLQGGVTNQYMTKTYKRSL